MIDFPKELATVDLEVPEIVLAMRVVVGIECLERLYPVEDLSSQFVSQGRDASGHHDLAASKRLPEGIVEIADALGSHRRLAPWTPLGGCRRVCAGAVCSPA